MLRLPFFHLSADAYLYPGKVKATGARKQLEEPVRQWCAYELIRAYGIPVNSIEFERPVRMGSSPHYIDILVSREGKPAVVLECKKLTDQDAEKGMAQAISYADAPELRAEFAVYTNGKDWHVKRRINERWCAVPDLPEHIHWHGAMRITDLLQALEGLAPLLYKLHSELVDEGARRFLRAMQRFFYGANLLTSNLDRDLLVATDNLLRVMSLAEEHPNYRQGKLATAIKHFETYRTKRGLEFEISMDNEPMSHGLRYLHASLLNIIEVADKLSGPEVSLLRLNAALSQYAERQGLPNKYYPQIGSSLHNTLHEFLNSSMICQLNTSLPDHLDNILIGDLREYCRSAWDKVEADTLMSFWDRIKALADELFRKLGLSRA